MGLIQGAECRDCAGHRPLSSMTPTIVLKDGKVRYVIGSPGGSRIITTVANILLSSVDGGLNIQQAVDAPRFHHQYLPDFLYMEPGFPASTVDGLRTMGYQDQTKQPHLVRRRMHRRRSKDRRVVGRPGPPPHFGKVAGY